MLADRIPQCPQGSSVNPAVYGIRVLLDAVLNLLHGAPYRVDLWLRIKDSEAP